MLSLCHICASFVTLESIYPFFKGHIPLTTQRKKVQTERVYVMLLLSIKVLKKIQIILYDAQNFSFDMTFGFVLICEFEDTAATIIKISV